MIFFFRMEPWSNSGRIPVHPIRSLWKKRPDVIQRQGENMQGRVDSQAGLLWQRDNPPSPMVKIGQIAGRIVSFSVIRIIAVIFPRKRMSFLQSRIYLKTMIRPKNEGDRRYRWGDESRFRWGKGEACPPDRRMLQSSKRNGAVADILKSIRARTGLDVFQERFFLPAKGEDEIKGYYDTGIKAIGLVWKYGTKNYTRRSAQESLRMWVMRTLFVPYGLRPRSSGRKRLRVFVMGLEPKNTFLEGVKEMTALGANVVPLSGRLTRGSKLEGHRAPPANGLWRRTGGFRDRPQSSHPFRNRNHCYRCDGNSLLHDALRLKGTQWGWERLLSI